MRFTLSGIRFGEARADASRPRALCLDQPRLIRSGGKTLHFHSPGGTDTEISKSMGVDDINENKKQNKLFRYALEELR